MDNQVLTLIDGVGQSLTFTLLQVVRIQSSAYALLQPEEAKLSDPGTVVILRMEEQGLSALDGRTEFDHVLAHLARQDGPVAGAESAP